MGGCHSRAVVVSSRIMDRICFRRSRALVQRVGTAAAVVAYLVAGTVVGPAAAQTPVPAPEAEPAPAEAPAPPKPPERTAEEKAIIEAAIRLYHLRADLYDVEKDLAATTTKLEEAVKALAETERKLTEARGLVAELRSRLQARAAIVYQRHSDRLGMALSVNRVIDLSAGNHYAESVAAVDNREVERLESLIDALESERNQRDATRRDLAATKSKQEAQLAELRATADKESAAINALGGVPVMGASTLTAPELAEWFKSTGQRAHLAGTTTIDELTELYVNEGTAENVRGDLAFAQAVLETGSFGGATDNNYAGIGACDSCTSQFLFPTPRDGVRAQIQHLKNYADPTSRAAKLANPPDATLYGGDPARAAFNFDSFFAKGRAPVWNIMGAGNWATDPLYAGKVLSIYKRMLDFKAGAPKSQV
jgi:flagellar motility protein MotE (MotC chaperone)